MFRPHTAVRHGAVLEAGVNVNVCNIPVKIAGGACRVGGKFIFHPLVGLVVKINQFPSLSDKRLPGWAGDFQSGDFVDKSVRLCA